jgi:tripartite-type tricarboxylate transporter receptor subunit TctC
MIVTSAKRFAALPGVDSVADVGLADTQTLLWRAVIAPAGLPADRLLKLQEVFRRAMSDPGFKTFAEARGEETWPADSINENTFAHNEFITVEQLADKLKLMAAP